MFDLDNAEIVHSQNCGDLVVCDFCNSDGKKSTGGVLIGSNAVCGDCCEKNNYYDSEYENADEIDLVFSKDKTFQENVLEYRKQETGSSDGILQILTWRD
tara:strand:+ start:261 stop:560 length:300 start_codon:yes stop_codon:yes gene_type:complete